MPRPYLFFIRDTLPQPAAHLIQTVQCANAAANLGYPTQLAFVDRGSTAWQPWRWVNPQPQPVDDAFARFFNIQNRLELLPLAMPWPIDRVKHKLTNASTVACKYYWPRHLATRTALVHTRDWNFAKAALKQGVPVVFECHHHTEKPFEPEMATHPLLQVVVTVIDTVRESIVRNGVPEKKVITVPNGFNTQFLTRHPAAAQEWRDRLLTPPFTQLVVYAGALHEFKGVNLLLEIAPQFPQVKFALAGGPVDQQQHYCDRLANLGLENVDVLGFLAQQDLAHLLQAADALAHPHLLGKAATFTSPLKLFDYLASGTPVVATRIPSLENWPLAAQIADWCDPNQPPAFANSLRQVLTQHPRPAEGFAPNVDALRPYSWEVRTEKILSHVEARYHPQLPGGNP
ncbi:MULTISPECIES: glycosyltransferase family 4 protein [Cyanophyceae]|uniref:Glycosyltransferase family 4 protein n=1 Tax=Leptolyngbya subtilissima DQ-A4 TaxID=2933933 RepID=A0ABV0K617_9CYAN|nr:glycosyltransferase family 4 protein [Nodosilinea sp. FACHB-141]MBD2114491.1 glycosyltransferase family 4 protein [Nodosilinea sp. FACHB-141]